MEDTLNGQEEVDEVEVPAGEESSAATQAEERPARGAVTELFDEDGNQTIPESRILSPEEILALVNPEDDDEFEEGEDSEAEEESGEEADSGLTDEEEGDEATPESVDESVAGGDSEEDAPAAAAEQAQAQAQVQAPRVGDVAFGNYKWAQDGNGYAYVTDGVERFYVDAQGRPYVPLEHLQTLRQENPAEYAALKAGLADAQAQYSAHQDALLSQVATSNEGLVRKHLATAEVALKKEYAGLGTEGAEEVAKKVTERANAIFGEMVAAEVQRVKQQSPGIGDEQARRVALSRANTGDVEIARLKAEREVLKGQLLGTGTKSAAAAGGGKRPAAGRVVPPAEGRGGAGVGSAAAGGGGGAASEGKIRLPRYLAEMGLTPELVQAGREHMNGNGRR